MKDGILVVDKPKDFTSHDVVAKIRKQLQTKKVGHTGTLDPMATGVLVVCVGAATKLVEYLTAQKKGYRATLQLGIRTNTADITGEVIEQIKEDEVPNLSEQEIQNVMQSFLGKQMQTPPMYSSIKVNGQKLYEYARKGIAVTIEPREIEIFAIQDVVKKGKEISFTVYCSKGTYIRTLCEDIAKKLGTCGTMTALRRIQNGDYTEEQAIPLEDVSEETILPLEKLFDKSIVVEKEIKKLLNGVEIACDKPDGLYNLYTNHYIGIGRIKDKKLKREIIL